MAEEIDVLIRQKRQAEEATARFASRDDELGSEVRDAFRLEELPGLIGKPVGVDEKEIKTIVDRWLR